MPVSICIYSNVVKQGQFFLFHNVQRILLKDFWIFYPKCTLNSADFFPIFVYWIMRQNSHFTVPLPYTMLCCLCNVCCYCTRLLSYSCCFITKVTIGLFHRVLMLSPLLSVPLLLSSDVVAVVGFLVALIYTAAVFDCHCCFLLLL